MISYIIVAYLLGLVPMYMEVYRNLEEDGFLRFIEFIVCCLIVTFWPITLPFTLLFLPCKL